MTITEKQQAEASAHMTDALGTLIAVTLIAADDHPGAVERIHAMTDNFPATELRDGLSGLARSEMLLENVRDCRKKLRDLSKILYSIVEEKRAVEARERYDKLMANKETAS